MQKATVFAIIPCLDEEKNLGNLLDKLKSFSVTPIVVDDGSTDKTAEIAQGKAAIVLRHQRNRGPGAAIRTGYAYVRDHFEPHSTIFVVAGDGQHRPEDMETFVRKISNGEADYVVGERFSSRPCRFGMPAANFVFGRILNLWTTLILRIDVKDSTCGFTAIRMLALKRLQLNLPERAGETHAMLLECVKHGLKVAFVPIKPIYGPKSRISKLMLFKNVLKVHLRAIKELR